MKTDEQIMKVVDVLIEAIDWEGQSVREAVNDDHVVELAMSIAKKGLLEPIVVQPKEDGRFQGCAGFHRTAAFSRLGKTHIPANIRANDNTPVKALALIENIIRRDMSLDEEVKAVAYLNTEEELSPSQICDLLGKGRKWVDDRLYIPNMPEDVRRELLDGNITIGKAEALSRLTDSGTRALVLNQVIGAKLTNKQTDDLINLYLDTPTIQSAVEEGIKTAQALQAPQPTFRGCYCCKDVFRIEELQYIPICIRCGHFFITNKIDHEKVEEETKHG